MKRCRHVGLKSFDAQAKLTAIAMNLKRMVRLLCGVRFYQGSTMPVAA